MNMDEFVEWMVIQEVPNIPGANAHQMQHLGKGWTALDSLADCLFVFQFRGIRVAKTQTSCGCTTWI